MSNSLSSTLRHIVVTGSNKGIGKEIVRNLGQDSNNIVILGCRDLERGRAAADEIQSSTGLLNIEVMQLDLASMESIEKFVSEVEQRHGKLDCLVNNAGMAFKGSDPTPMSKQAAPTFQVNYYGTVEITKRMLPLLRKSSQQPRIVNVASMAGHLRILAGKPELSRMLSDCSRNGMTLEDLAAKVARPFIHDVEQGTHAAHGFPNTCYGMSKLCLIAATKIFARDAPDILVNACCPGYCSTDMSSHRGTKTAAEGAVTPTLLASGDIGRVTGQFWREGSVVEW